MPCDTSKLPTNTPANTLMAQSATTQTKPMTAVPGNEEHAVVLQSNGRSTGHLHLWVEPSMPEEDSVIEKSVQRNFFLCGSRSVI